MDKLDKLKKIFVQSNGIVKTDSIKNIGFTNEEISKLCTLGVINRIKHGYYCLSDEFVSDEKIISILLSDTVICLETALYYHGYCDCAPQVWSLAVPRTYSRTKLKFESLHLKPKFIQNDLFDLGKSKILINGFELNIYDKERTICDCFKYKNQLDREIFNKAIYAYIADENKNLINLSNYAKKMRVYRKVSDVMEVLLNGWQSHIRPYKTKKQIKRKW